MFGRHDIIMRGPMGGDSFTIISNSFFRDKRISAKAKGIFGYLSTHRAGWPMNIGKLAMAMRMGEDSIKAGLRELEACHYLIRKQWRDESGHFGASTWFITDIPAQLLRVGITDLDLVGQAVWASFEDSHVSAGQHR